MTAELIGPPDLRSMTTRQKLNVLKARGIELDLATSHGGGNRDHNVWSVEFRGPGLENRYVQIQVRCRTYSGKFDGKRACEREAKELAVAQLLGLDD